MTTDAKIAYHPLGLALAGEAADQPTVPLIGYAAPAQTADHVRLYLDPAGAAWIDVPLKVVASSGTLPPVVGYPRGASVLVVACADGVQPEHSVVLGGELAGLAVTDLTKLRALLPRLARFLASAADGGETGPVHQDHDRAEVQSSGRLDTQAKFGP
jgi:hypothetical protein